jgi:hypothetical protein
MQRVLRTIKDDCGCLMKKGINDIGMYNVKNEDEINISK